MEFGGERNEVLDLDWYHKRERLNLNGLFIYFTEAQVK